MSEENMKNPRQFCLIKRNCLGFLECCELDGAHATIISDYSSGFSGQLTASA